jgi:phosphate transport system protein
VRRPSAKHSSRDFEAELRELRAHILAMGARCERIVGLAFDAFLQRTPDAAREVFDLDAHIDRDDLAIHALIMRMLALRQPVADDLRFLTTALRLITDLERIGDEAVNIAERALAGGAQTGGLVDCELALMSAAARDMLHLALDSFIQGDEMQADHVLECDDEVDRRCGAIISAMAAHMSGHPGEVGEGLRAIRVAKYLERIGDHATNVAEQVIFMVRGDDVRHGGWRRGGRPAATAPESPHSEEVSIS